MNENLRKRITALKETEFTKDIVIPLIQVLHAGPIEYTHSAVEAGRDIVSFGRDYLGREHVLCVQVKSTPISTGAKFFGGLSDVLSVAKENGVTMQSGRTIYPHEVWLITPYPFPESSRRQVAGSLQKLEENNIKIVAFEELVQLLLRNTPEIVAQFSPSGGVKAAELIRLLSEHQEAVAFGLTSRRLLPDFFVPIAVIPNAAIATRVLGGRLSLGDRHTSLSLPLSDILRPNEVGSRTSDLRSKLTSRLQAEYEKSQLTNHGIAVKVSVNIDSSKVSPLLRTFHRLHAGQRYDTWGEILDKLGSDKKLVQSIRTLADLTINHEVQYRIENRLTKLISAIKSAYKSCGGELTDKPKVFSEFIKSVRDLDNFCSAAVDVAEKRSFDKAKPMVPLRIRVTKPAALAGTASRILIQGPPGCGKTTFLRNLTIQLLDAGEAVVYVPCSAIRKIDKSKGLSGLVDKFSKKYGVRRKTNRDTVLVLDGLDESGLDLSGTVRKSKEDFRTIIVSSRKAYQSDIGAEAVKIELDLFSRSERDEFFRKWFADDSEPLRRIRKLVSQSSDIEYHTRLPLIASITAALVENHFEPSNRCEIYDYRLELLLSRWDVVKGVRRLRIKDDKAKRRFLRALAYKVHTAPIQSRVFGKDVIREIYDSALGSWGYDHTIDELLEDLVKASGLLVEESFQEGTEFYSFGHLSFQEHLVGEYLWETKVGDVDILRRIEDPWWHEVLLFYAYKRQDVGSIIEKAATRSDAIFQIAHFLLQMAKNAPYTPLGAIELLQSILNQMAEDRFADSVDSYSRPSTREVA